MNILLTGATGFIGKYLLKSLIENGHCCRCLVRTTTSQVDKSFDHPLIELFYGDVEDLSSLKGIGKDIDAACHLAAAGRLADFSEKKFNKSGN